MVSRWQKGRNLASGGAALQGLPSLVKEKSCQNTLVQVVGHIETLDIGGKDTDSPKVDNARSTNNTEQLLGSQLCLALPNFLARDCLGLEFLLQNDVLIKYVSILHHTHTQTNTRTHTHRSCHRPLK